MIKIDQRVSVIENLFQSWNGVDFEWGMRDCVCLCAANVWALGHKVNFKTGMYGTERGAIKAVKKAGFETLEQAIDNQEFLERVAPAFLVPGDILGISLPEKDGWPALSISIGNGRVFGFFDNGDGHCKCSVMEPRYISDCKAWRVLECHPLSD